MASSAPNLRKARAQPNAIECSLAMPSTRAFWPSSGGEGMAAMCVSSSKRLADISSARNQHQRVLGNHQLLVRRNDQDGNGAAWATDAQAISVVFGPIQLDAEPVKFLADLGADKGRVFPDPGGENEGIQTSEHCRVSADELDAVVGEIVDRLGCFGRAALLEFAHVAAHAGDTEQTRFLIEKRLHGRRIHPVGFQQVQQNARIDLADAGRHRQPFDRAESHRGLDALAVEHRAQAAAAAEMGDYDPPGIRCVPRKLPADVIEGDAVIAPVAQVPLTVLARQRVELGDPGHGPVKRSIKASDLRDRRSEITHRANHGKLVRLMRWLKSAQGVEIGKDLIRDEDGLLVLHAAEHDAVADAEDPYISLMPQQPLEDELQRAILAQRIAYLPFMGVERLAVPSLGDEARMTADPLDLTATNEVQTVAAVVLIAGKLDTG